MSQGEEVRLSDEAAAPGDMRPKRQGLFRSNAAATLAAISMTCSGIGLGSLGLEVLMMAIVKQGPIGTMAGLPVPFVSIPLGAGGLGLAGLLLVTQPRVALLPVVSTLAYMITLGFLWWSL